MTKFHEPEVHSPRELEAGDQVGVSNAGRTLNLVVGEPYGEDPDWATLCNDPGQTTHVWDEPVPHGQVALDLAGHGWKVQALPQVWARRRIS
jgi:hypothetical protein